MKKTINKRKAITFQTKLSLYTLRDLRPTMSSNAVFEYCEDNHLDCWIKAQMRENEDPYNIVKMIQKMDATQYPIILVFDCPYVLRRAFKTCDELESALKLQNIELHIVNERIIIRGSNI